MTSSNGNIFRVTGHLWSPVNHKNYQIIDHSIFFIQLQNNPMYNCRVFGKGSLTKIGESLGVFAAACMSVAARIEVPVMTYSRPSRNRGQGGHTTTWILTYINTTVTSWWARWRLKSRAPRLFIQPFIQAQIKENFKAPRHWPLWGEFTSYRWIPHTKGQ